MKSLTFNDVKSLLQSPKNIVIVCHVNPDGDAIGSSLGLYHYLIQKGHVADVIVPNDYPNFLKWIPGTSSVIQFEKNIKKAIEEGRVYWHEIAVKSNTPKKSKD